MQTTVIPSLHSGNVTQPVKIYDTKTYWWLWVSALIVITLAFSVTLGIAPYLHKDEFMIVDLGRIILNPSTDWSITWLVDKQEPVYFFSYLGTVLQELSYRVAGQYGPRMTGLIGALAAATILVGWLLSRGTTRWAAFVLGLVFLLDPLFVQAFTIGRVDGWVMALCLGCCWVLRDTWRQPFRSFTVRLMLAGALASAAFFIWPSAVFLYPLIAMELVCLARRGRAGGGSSLLAAWRPVLLFAGGGALATLLLLIPIAPHLFAQLSNALATINANIQAGPEWGEDLKFAPIRGMISNLKFTPVLVIFSFIGIVKYREYGLTIVLLITFLMIVATIVYIHRILYLIPYLIACIGYVYHNRFHMSLSRLFRLGGLVALLLWAVGLSLGVRSFYAFDTEANRDRVLVHEAAMSLLGSGNHKVLLLNTVELYYPGRALGWSMYAPYLAMGESLKPEILHRILPQVESVIIKSPVAEETVKALNAGGMYNVNSYSIYDNSAQEFDGITTNEWRIRFLYAIYKQPYGPYALFARRNGTSTQTELTSINAAKLW